MLQGVRQLTHTNPHHAPPHRSRFHHPARRLRCRYEPIVGGSARHRRRERLTIHRMRALITMAALVCCTLSHAQIIDSTYILAVDRLVQEIDGAKDYEIRTLENEEFLEQMTDGGGELTGYVKNGQIVKIASRVWVSSCAYISEYYFDRSKLVFVQEQGYEFAYDDSTGSIDPAVQNLTMVNRYYFRNGASAPVSQKGTTRCSGDGAPIKETIWMYHDRSDGLKELLMRE